MRATITPAGRSSECSTAISKTRPRRDGCTRLCYDSAKGACVALVRLETRLRRTAPVHHFVPLALEGVNPLVDGQPVFRAGARGSGWEARHVEQIVKLRVGELDEQIGQKLAAALADRWIIEGSGHRLGEVADTACRVLPHSGVRPFVEVHASGR